MRLFSQLYANRRCREFLPDSDRLLTECATTLTFHEFRLVCQRWQANADPDGAHADHQLSRNNRHVTTSRLGAGHQLHAEGDALTGEMMTRILDAHADAEFDIDLAERATRFGDRCCHPGCEQRIARIQIDHLDPWAARAGSTNPFNGGPCCPRHNRAKQHGRITVTRDSSGWRHHRPDGTEIAPRTGNEHPRNG